MLSFLKRTGTVSFIKGTVPVQSSLIFSAPDFSPWSIDLNKQLYSRTLSKEVFTHSLKDPF
ncbi:protein of unknown function [Ruminococcaceae bacterium BL-4]|jgi:hypothetical protein|nr:protein of unknown function [Ruminococcaceae bacterium BL-4]